MGDLLLSLCRKWSCDDSYTFFHFCSVTIYVNGVEMKKYFSAIFGAASAPSVPLMKLHPGFIKFAV